MDQAGSPKSLKGHVQSREDLPIAGLFAQRGPSRPAISITAEFDSPYSSPDSRYRFGGRRLFSQIDR
jgi:hypothetical protein